MRAGPLVRVAMVGNGWAARSIWLPRFEAHPAYSVVAVVDPDAAARERGAENGVACLSSVAELSPASVDLAVVAVPNHLHADVAEELLTRGITVFVEKPVCLSTEQAERLAAAELAGGATLLAGSAVRFRHDVRALLEAAATVGHVRHVSLGWIRARGIPNGVGWFTRRYLSGGGALLDLGWHLLDAVSPLLGDDRLELAVGTLSDDFINDGTARAGWRADADTGEPLTGDVEDTARGFLVTRDRVSVSLTASWASHQPADETSIVVEGSTGTVRLACTFGFSPNRLEVSELTLIRSGATTCLPVPFDPIGIEYDRLVDELTRCVVDPRMRGAAIRQATRTVDAIERMYRSASTPAFPAPRTSPEARAARAVVFDMDGVLVNSFDVMRRAFICAYREVVGDGEPPFAEYNRHLGRYFPDIMRIMGLPLEMEGPFVRESTRLAGEVPMFPGVRELLVTLHARGIGLAVATGKAGWRARSLLEHLGVLDLFEHVIGSDEVARSKPAPDIVLRALELLDVRPDDAVMVGDAVTDLAAARGAGVRAVAALWADVDEAALLAEEPDVCLRAPAELLALCPVREGGTTVPEVITAI